MGACVKSGKKPVRLPSDPSYIYKEEWKGWGDWLGTGIIAPQNREYRSFEEAREFVRSLGLKSWEEWEAYCGSAERPLDIPSMPDRVYKNEYKGMEDWLGYKIDLWIPRRVKELLQDLIKSGIIYTWDEAVLYSFLNRKGVLNLSNRHSQFFKSLIEASRTNEGRKAIEEYANSDSETPPDLSKLTPFSKEIDQWLQFYLIFVISSRLFSVDFVCVIIPTPLISATIGWLIISNYKSRCK